MADNFNIRDNIWDLLFLFYLIHSNLLVPGSFDFILSCSTNQVLTRYLDNMNDANSVINLIVVATTYHKGQMISLTSKPQSGSIMWEFTRELDKESLLN